MSCLGGELDSTANADLHNRALEHFEKEVRLYSVVGKSTGEFFQIVSRALGPWYEKFPVNKGTGSRSSGLFSPGAGGKDKRGEDDGAGAAGAGDSLEADDFDLGSAAAARAPGRA